MFCEKLQNVCSVAANLNQMDRNVCDFWTQRPPNPLQTSYTPYQDPQHANNNIATSPKYSSKKETHRDVPMAQ